MFRNLSFGALVGVLITAGTLPADEKAEDASAQARKAIDAYLKAFKAEDIEAVMKVSGVPFVMNDRGKIDAEQNLRTEFARLFDRSDMGKVGFKVKAVGTLDEVKDGLGEAKHADKLKAIVKDGDRVVLVDADFGKRPETMAFSVSLRDGEAYVVAMFD